MTAVQMPTECPKCGGSEFYDNRAENAERVARGEKARPNFKCKNRSCDYAQWPPKQANGRPPVQQAPKPQAAPSAYVGDLPGDAGAVDFQSLCKRYAECVGYVVNQIVPALTAKDIGVDPATVSSMAAAIWIERNKRNV